MSKIIRLTPEPRRRVRLEFTGIELSEKNFAFVWDSRMLSLETLLLERFGLEATEVMGRWATAIMRQPARRGVVNAN